MGQITLFCDIVLSYNITGLTSQWKKELGFLEYILIINFKKTFEKVYHSFHIYKWQRESVNCYFDRI